MNIALTGRLRSGKSTVSAYLTQRYGYTEFAFGDELKRYAHEIFDVPRDPKPRELYQWFGQTMRLRDPDVWVRKCLRKVDRMNYARKLVNDEEGEAVYEPVRAVISDLRQPSELSALRDRGYTIIRVNAPDGLRINRAVESADTFSHRELAHETESHVDGFAVNYDVYNVGTTEELYRQIDAIMEVPA